MTRTILALALALTVALLGCGGQEEPVKSKPDAKEPAWSAGRPSVPELKAADRNRETYLKQTDARLEELKQAINEMQTKLEKLSPELKARVDEQLKVLEPKMAAARRKVQELKFAGGEAYKKLQSEVEALLEDLKKGVEQLPSGFQFKP